MPNSPCPSPEELSAFVHGTADLANSSTIGEHLDRCPDCDEIVATFETSVDELVGALQGAAADDEFVAESEYRKALAAIGRDPSFVTRTAPTEVVQALPGAGRVRDYQLLKVLGAGGMGTVYQALHTQLEKIVAVKLLGGERMRDLQAVSRFKREMKAVGRLDHPQIVRAFDGGVADDTHFLVMEYIAGIDLRELVSCIGPLPIPDACEIIRQAAQGLQHVHENGLVHRDIKPSNLMLAFASRQPQATAARTDATTVKILDLGLALLHESQPANGALTASSQVMGTIDYMAPEQCENSHAVDIRADLYSLGCTLYQLLTGVAPFGGPEYDRPVKKALAHVAQAPPAITTRRPDVPAPLAAIVHRLLAKSPADRFASPADVADALKPFTAGSHLSELAARVQRSSPAVRIAGEGPGSTDDHFASAMADTDAARKAEFPVKARQSAHEGSSVSHASSASERPAAALRGRLFLFLASAATCMVIGAAIILRGNSGAEIGKSGGAPGRPLPVVASLERGDEGSVAQAASETEKAAPGAGAAADVPRVFPIAIFSFEERGAGVTGYGNKISDFLLATLAGKPELYFVDRTDLKKILEEHELRLSGLAKPEEAVQVGRLTGAKILIGGSVVELDKTLVLSAKIIGTETGRIVTATVKGKTSDDLADLAEKLSAEVETTVARRTADLMPREISTTDRAAKLKKSLENKQLPKVWIQVAERHIGQATIDPAAETELALLCHASGFQVIDAKEGNRKQADVILEGEAFSEFATRKGNLVSVKARVEIKAVDRKTGNRLASDRQTEIAVDLAEHVAGKTALQHAAAAIAERLLPKIATGAK